MYMRSTIEPFLKDKIVLLPIVIGQRRKRIQWQIGDCSASRSSENHSVSLGRYQYWPRFPQRWWLTEPSTGSSLGLVIHNQYYVGATMPTDTGALRIHASWLSMELSTGDASDGAAISLFQTGKRMLIPWTLG